MTGLAVLKQAYQLLDDPKGAASAGEQDLVAVNQIYSELWYREHTAPFQPLDSLQLPLLLSWRCLPAMAYGVAMLLCLNDEEKPYTQFQALYERAAAHTGGPYGKRRDTLFGNAGEQEKTG